MQIILQTEECGGFVRFLPIQHLDPEIRRNAKDRFYDYRRQGIILNGSFESDRWQLTNQLHVFTLDFRIDTDRYRANAESWSGCTAECYLECMKAYIAFQFGRYTLVYLQQIANGLSALSGMTTEEAKTLSWDTRPQIIGFLSLLPESNDLRDQVVEALESQKWSVQSKRPRQLSEFSSYLRFNKALNDFWALASELEKKEFFPVYLWWKLTAILPLRCTEFLLTPRDCIRLDKGRYLLSIRRTQLPEGFLPWSHLLDIDPELFKTDEGADHEK